MATPAVMDLDPIFASTQSFGAYRAAEHGVAMHLCGPVDQVMVVLHTGYPR